MFPAGFEPAVTASERPEAHFLDGAITGISSVLPDRYHFTNATDTHLSLTLYDLSSSQS
jgi:hypothetical protein